MPPRARPNVNPTGCACRWDWGESCDQCVRDGCNPNALHYAPGALEAAVARFDKWAAESVGARP